MTVRELLNRITSKELTEWQLFYQLEPFGFEANYLGHAQTNATLVNVNKKKGTKRATADDFMPKFSKEHEGTEGAISLVAALTAMHGGEDKRK